MNEYILIFRNPKTGMEERPSPEEMQAMMRKWSDWMERIEMKNQLVNRGNQLGDEGRIIKPGKTILDGPFVEMKETIGGYIIVGANSLDEATVLCESCPIFDMGGQIEIRPLIKME